MNKASTWQEVPRVINNLDPIYQTVVYGLSRSLCGAEILVDCGDELGDIALMKLHFRNETIAERVYSKGFRIEIKVVKHPEHEE